jgi:predicted nucleic acid-binding protein
VVIFVDSNVIIRLLLQPSTSDYERMIREARELFAGARSGDYDLVTSEAHIAEVIFILTAKRHYGIPAETCAALLLTILREKCLKMVNKHVVLAAIEIWRNRPSLGFHDALALAYAGEADTRLATFDEVLQKTNGIEVWRSQ